MHLLRSRRHNFLSVLQSTSTVCSMHIIIGSLTEDLQSLAGGSIRLRRYGHVRQRLDVPQVTLFATLRPFSTQKLPGIIDVQFLMSNTSALYLVARHPILSTSNPSSTRTSQYYCCAYVLYSHHRSTIFYLYPLSPLLVLHLFGDSPFPVSAHWRPLAGVESS